MWGTVDDNMNALAHTNFLCLFVGFFFFFLFSFFLYFFFIIQIPFRVYAQ